MSEKKPVQVLSEYMSPPELNNDYVRLSMPRFVTTLDFIGPQLSAGEGLDIGEDNPLSQMIRDKYHIPVDNTSVDLNEEPFPWEGRYDYIFDFEVLEHLFNPLFHLRQLHKALKPGGRVFLSTPRGKPYFLWHYQHFHEIHPKQFYFLLDYAGFEVVRSEVRRTHDLGFYLTGLRPLLRYYFDRIYLVELRKKQGAQ